MKYNNIKVPDELFVTMQYYQAWGDTPSDESPLGFLHPYEPHTKAGQKRQNTQLDWAYGGYCTTNYTDESGYLCQKGRLSTYDRDADQFIITEYDRRVPDRYQPAVWKNEPLDGFKVLTTVSRYSTSNKLWRILDPRGVQFEVTTGNFEALLMSTTIEKGLILGKCVWKANKALIVVEA